MLLRKGESVYEFRAIYTIYNTLLSIESSSMASKITDISCDRQ